MRKKLVLRKSLLPSTVPTKGPYRGKKVYLLKRGFSGWHGKLDSGELIYLFNEEL